jgi:ethanolamine transporter EutH
MLYFNKINFKVNYKLLLVIPILIFTNIINIALTFVPSAMFFIYLLSQDYNKHLSLLATLVIAVAIFTHIIDNHKINIYVSNILKKGDKSND